MTNALVLAFLDEMSKIACGDMLQYFQDHPEKLKAKLERDKAKHKKASSEPSYRVQAKAYGGKKSKNSTKYHWAKEKKSSPEDMALALRKEAGLAGAVARDVKRIPHDVAVGVKRTPRLVSATAQRMFTDPVKGLKHGWRSTVRDTRRGGLRMFGNVAGAALTLPEAYDAIKKEDPTGQNRSRFHRVARFAGSQAGNLIGTPFGFPGQLAGGILGTQIGSTVGSLYDRIKGRPKMPAQHMVQGPPQAMQSERVQG